MFQLFMVQTSYDRTATIATICTEYCWMIALHHSSYIHCIICTSNSASVAFACEQFQFIIACNSINFSESSWWRGNVQQETALRASREGGGEVTRRDILLVPPFAIECGSFASLHMYHRGIGCGTFHWYKTYLFERRFYQEWTQDHIQDRTQTH